MPTTTAKKGTVKRRIVAKKAALKTTKLVQSIPKPRAKRPPAPVHQGIFNAVKNLVLDVRVNINGRRLSIASFDTLAPVQMFVDGQTGSVQSSNYRSYANPTPKTVPAFVLKDNGYTFVYTKAELDAIVHTQLSVSAIIQGLWRGYHATLTPTIMTIGCKNHSLDWWAKDSGGFFDMEFTKGSKTYQEVVATLKASLPYLRRIQANLTTGGAFRALKNTIATKTAAKK